MKYATPTWLHVLLIGMIIGSCMAWWIDNTLNIVQMTGLIFGGLANLLIVIERGHYQQPEDTELDRLRRRNSIRSD